MQITYQLTQQDYNEAFLLARRQRVILKWFIRLMFVWVLFVFASLLVASVKAGHTVEGVFPFAGLCVVSAALPWAEPLWYARKQFRTKPSARAQQTFWADSEGLHWRYEGGSIDLGWGNFVSAKESARVILIFTAEFSFFPLPKRAFRGEQLDELRTLLSTYVAAK